MEGSAWISAKHFVTHLRMGSVRDQKSSHQSNEGYLHGASPGSLEQDRPIASLFPIVSAMHSEHTLIIRFGSAMSRCNPITLHCPTA